MRAFIEAYWPFLWIGSTVAGCLLVAWVWPWPPQGAKE
jgi:hypothetical protein